MCYKQFPTFLCTIMYYTSTDAAFVFYGTWTMPNGFIFLTVQHDTAWFCCCFISRFCVFVFIFYNRVDSNHGHTKCVHLIFIPQFLMGLIDFLPKNKHGQEQLVFWFFLDLKYGLLATFWESRVLGAEDGRSGRRLLFCSLCFQPLPDGTCLLYTSPSPRD